MSKSISIFHENHQIEYFQQGYWWKSEFISNLISGETRIHHLDDEIF